jgi:DNA-binding ferritin-like protein
MKLWRTEVEIELPDELKERVMNLTTGITSLFEETVKEYEEKVSKLEERIEELEQENIELKYKLRQLSNDLKNLSEKITAEFLSRAESALEEVRKLEEKNQE